MAKEPPPPPPKPQPILVPTPSSSEPQKVAVAPAPRSRLMPFLIGFLMGLVLLCGGLGLSGVLFIQKRSLERDFTTAKQTWQDERDTISKERKAILAEIEGMKTAEAQRIESEKQKRVETKRDQNLKRIAKAFIDWEEANGDYPNNSYDVTGKPLLSWRVQILPWLGLEELYDQFQFGEAWDSTKNKALLAKMPEIFSIDGDLEKAQGKTHYRGFSHKGALLAPRYANGIKVTGTVPKKGPASTIPKMILSAKLVTDGVANTILCVEASEPVEWTKPDDFSYPLKGKGPSFGTDPNLPFRVVSLDGQIHLIPRETPEAFIKGWSTFSGNEKNNWP